MPSEELDRIILNHLVHFNDPDNPGNLMFPPELAKRLGLEYPNTLPPYYPPQTVIPGLEMEYFEEWRRLFRDKCPNYFCCGPERGGFNSHHVSFMAREWLTRTYAWAIPSPEALLAVQAIDKPIVEIGAGNGYWGMLLRSLGVECHLYDLDPPTHVETHYCKKGTWSEVLPGDVKMARRHSNCALLLCWPPYGDSMADESLRAYRGNTLVFVGESADGCTADDRFFKYIDTHFEEQTRIHLPQFYGIHDDLWVFKR